MLLWYVFTPPIRPVPSLLAIVVFCLGAWLQFGHGVYSTQWVFGLVTHVLFSIFVLFKQGAANATW